MWQKGSSIIRDYGEALLTAVILAVIIRTASPDLPYIDSKRKSEDCCRYNHEWNGE